MNCTARLPLMIALLTIALSGRAEALPDPTKPPSFSVAPVVVELTREQLDWTVTAIRTAEQDRTAIVNGRLVREGESIGPAKVLSIFHDRVVLEHDNRQVGVRLLHGAVLRTPAATISENANN